MTLPQSGSGQGGAVQEFVNLTIDGKPVRAPKGMNLIEAARLVGIEIPHYCYHPDLSIAGNCRMCQCEVKGAPKLEIGCNATVREGMEVRTQETSQTVKDAQAATLEFILINHPLDCTVCDQAGHCKLQDYHYDYNAKASRFLEEKEHKVKAEPLGPHIMLDGERCIMCTRCIRFCDEVTETSELGMLNRGDRSVISINPGKELTNPLSGSVVDLCPVGALTHRDWRFNTRIWFTRQSDGICPGCSTGCNVRVAERDSQVVQVKARYNGAVNKEWLCDEGRYGFERFLPAERIAEATAAGKPVAHVVAALEGVARCVPSETLILVAPTLTLEELWLTKKLIQGPLMGAQVAMSYRSRALSTAERVLVSPNKAANARGAEFLELVKGDPEKAYQAALDLITARPNGKGLSALILLGDWSILPGDYDERILQAIAGLSISVGALSDACSPLRHALRAVVPARTILEGAGLLMNRGGLVQYTGRLVEPTVDAALPMWRVIQEIARVRRGEVSKAATERELTLEFLAAEPRLSGQTIASIKQGGVLPQGSVSGSAAPALGSEAR